MQEGPLNFENFEKSENYFPFFRDFGGVFKLSYASFLLILINLNSFPLLLLNIWKIELKSKFIRVNDDLIQQNSIIFGVKFCYFEI